MLPAASLPRLCPVPLRAESIGLNPAKSPFPSRAQGDADRVWRPYELGNHADQLGLRPGDDATMNLNHELILDFAFGYDLRDEAAEIRFSFKLPSYRRPHALMRFAPISR
jgi:hypothetical protein